MSRGMSGGGHTAAPANVALAELLASASHHSGRSCNQTWPHLAAVTATTAPACGCCFVPVSSGSVGGPSQPTRPHPPAGRASRPRGLIALLAAMRSRPLRSWRPVVIVDKQGPGQGSSWDVVTQFRDVYCIKVGSGLTSCCLMIGWCAAHGRSASSCMQVVEPWPGHLSMLNG